MYSIYDDIYVQCTYTFAWSRHWDTSTYGIQQSIILRAQFVYIRVRARMCILSMYMYVRTCTNIHIYIYIYMNACTCTCMSEFVLLVYMCLCRYALHFNYDLCVHTYIHARYTHKQYLQFLFFPYGNQSRVFENSN